MNTKYWNFEFKMVFSGIYIHTSFIDDGTDICTQPIQYETRHVTLTYIGIQKDLSAAFTWMSKVCLHV